MSNKPNTMVPVIATIAFVVIGLVIAAIGGSAWDEYLACVGDCAAHSSEKVRSVIAAGAARVSFVGNGADVPTDLASRV